MTVAEAQRAASEIAKEFGTFECDRCAREIAKMLRKGFLASFEKLCTADNSDVIGLVKEDVQVSANQVHVGVCIGDKIIDNFHPQGVLAAEWPGRFMAATEVPLLRRSRPLSDFFGKIFLTKKFNQWLYGRQ